MNVAPSLMQACEILLLVQPFRRGSAMPPSLAQPLRAMGLALLLALAASVHLLTADASSHEFEVRITARLVSSGSTEFALQQQDAGGAWSEHQLPTARYFPASAAEGQWLVSTPLHLDAPGTDASIEVRITARKNAGGFIEFALQRRSEDGAWGERDLPTGRFFPPTTAVNRWLVSTPLTVPTPGPAPAPTP